MPRADRPKKKKLRPIEGLPPSLADLPQGCRFRPRCSQAFNKCVEVPPLEARVGRMDHVDACWLSPEQKRVRRAAVIGLTGDTA